MFNKKEAEKTKLEKRVSRIPTLELVLWAEQALYGIGRGLTSWQQSKSEDEIREMEEGAKALLAVISELRVRTYR